MNPKTLLGLTFVGGVAALSGLYTEMSAQPDLRIAGQYSCQGTNPNGGTYSGRVDVKQIGQTYEILWSLGSGESYRGIGLRQDDVLSVAYGAGSSAGVVSYRIENVSGKAKLMGRWTNLGSQGRVMDETLTRR